MKDQQTKYAHTIISKLTSVVTGFEALTVNPAFVLIAASIAKPLTDAISTFRAILADCNAMVTGSEPLAPIPDPKSVAALVATAKKSAAVITGMLVQIVKAQGLSR